MQIDERSVGDVVVLDLKGKITMGDANQLLKDKINSLLQQGQKKILLNQEAEIVSLAGSITMDAQGRSVVHGHGSVALSDGTVKGGHWFEAHVSIIAEAFVTEEEGAPEAPK